MPVRRFAPRSYSSHQRPHAAHPNGSSSMASLSTSWRLVHAPQAHQWRSQGKASRLSWPVAPAYLQPVGRDRPAFNRVAPSAASSRGSGHGGHRQSIAYHPNTFPDSRMNFNLHSGAQWRRLTNSTKLVPGDLHQKFESHPNSGLIQRRVFRPHLSANKNDFCLPGTRWRP